MMGYMELLDLRDLPLTCVKNLNIQRLTLFQYLMKFPVYRISSSSRKTKFSRVQSGEMF